MGSRGGQPIGERVPTGDYALRVYAYQSRGSDYSSFEYSDVFYLGPYYEGSYFTFGSNLFYNAHCFTPSS